jgi:uncharacterized protein
MERDLMAEAAATALPSNRVNRRLAFVRWVRRTHGWFGLWGALLGLMAGTSGIWLNHRSVMKLDLPDQQQTSTQLAMPEQRPATADAMASWLQGVLKVDRPATNVRVERSRPVPWAERGGEGRPAMQPERWTFVFGGPNKVIQVEYWVGNRSAGVRTTQNGFIATLTNLHKGTTMPAPWILLIDTLAGAMIFLSLSGVILWWETHRRRLAGVVIFGVSVAVTVALAMSPLQW